MSTYEWKQEVAHHVGAILAIVANVQDVHERAEFCVYVSDQMNGMTNVLADMRAAAWLQLQREGWSYTRIARRAGVSKQRVAEVLARCK